MTDYEQMVRMFLEEHPEHIVGAKWVKVPPKDVEELVLDKGAALALAEWCLAKGLYRDRAKLEAGIAKMRADWGAQHE